MPVRGEKKQNAPAKRNKLTTMQEVANAYNSINKTKKEDEKELKVYKEKIVTLLQDDEVGTPNGKHLECTVPMGDGKTNLFIQLQVAESVIMVDTIIPQLKEKLGEDELKPFIITKEVLHENALEQLYLSGKITALDVEELTITKETPRLIVKEVEVKG